MSSRKKGGTGSGSERGVTAPSLSSSHACVFNAILAEGVEKLRLLAHIASDSKTRGHQKRSTTDMHTLLLRREELERKYETLMRRRGQLRGLHNKKAYAENQKVIKAVAESLQKSITAISQNLSESNNPHLATYLAKVERDRWMLENLLILTQKEIQKEQTFQTLNMQVNTQLDELHNLSATKTKRNRIHGELKRLELIFKRESEIFEKDVKDRDEEIKKLTVELQQLKVETKLTLQYEEDTARAAANTSQRLIAKRLKQYDRDITGYMRKAERDSRVNQAAINFLKKRQEEMDEKSKEWSVKYKRDKKEYQIKLDDLREVRAKEKIRLDALKARKDKAMRDLERKMALESRKKIRLEQRRAEEKKMFTAASKIKFFWNVFWRKEGAKLAKKGKKKKK